MYRYQALLATGAIVTMLAGVSTPAAAAGSAPAGGRILSLAVSQGNGRGELRSARPDGTGMIDLGRELWWGQGPEYSPDGSLIAFAGGEYGFSIMTMKSDGTDDRWLADARCGPRGPHWSPDGRWLAFESCGDIWKLSSDGYAGGFVNLTNNFVNIDPSWAPHGRRIAAVADDGVRLYRADGSAPRVLTDLPHTFDLDWRPHGNTIAVEADGDLWLVDAVTGAKRQLTNTPGVVEADPVWSPDGRWLAYSSGTALPPPPPDPEQGPQYQVPFAQDPQIWLMTAAGTQRHSTGVSGIPASWRAAD